MLGELGFVEIIRSDFHHLFLELDHIIDGFLIYHFDSVLVKDADFALERLAWGFFENKAVFVGGNGAGLSSPG